MPTLDTATFWPPDSDRRSDEVRVTTGSISAKQTTQYLKLTASIHRKSDLPTDPTGWRVVATDTDGTHYPDIDLPAKITDVTRKMGHVRLTFRTINP